MATILVTGGAGYLGSHTAVELLTAGYHVIIIDNFSNSESFILERIERVSGKKPGFVMMDCNNAEQMDVLFKNNPDISGVIHFAAFKAVGESVNFPLKYYDNNIGCMNQLVRVMLNSGVRNFVFSSSCTVYGAPDEVAVTENTPFKPASSPYAFTKQVGEKLLMDLENAGIPWRSAVLRYFNPVGAHPSGLIGELPLGTPNNLIPYMTQTAAGLRKELNVFGNDYPTSDGTCIRDFIHVCDLAKAHVRALEWLMADTEPVREAFNIGTGEGKSVLDLVNLFQEENGITLKWKYAPRRPGDVPAIYAKADKANDVLKWHSEYSVGDALRHAWNWQKALK